MGPASQSSRSLRCATAARHWLHMIACRLANQIRNECEMLITFHKPTLSSLCVVGGTNVSSDVRTLKSPPAVLVATPGRLNDLLYNHGMTPLFECLLTLVFDEADQLLEMGFRPEVASYFILYAVYFILATHYLRAPRWASARR